MAKAPGPKTHFGGGLTPTSPQRSPQAAGADSTKAPPALHNPPMPNITHPKLTEHTRPAQLLGPTAWENGRDPVTSVTGKPPLRGTRRAGALPPEASP